MTKKQKLTDEGNILPVNKDKTYGIQIPTNRAYVAVHTRKKYTEDTSVPYPDVKGGGMSYKLYKAGDYGEWELIFGPYHSSLERAIKRILELSVIDGLTNGDKLINLPSAIEAKYTEIKQELALIDWKQISKSES